MTTCGLIEPLHVAVIGGYPLRFFPAPLGGEEPHLSWYVVDDLSQCLRLNREGRRIMLRKLQGNKGWSAYLRTVATPDGPVIVAPHFMAESTIEAMVRADMVPMSVRAEYDRAASEAQNSWSASASPSTKCCGWPCVWKAARPRQCGTRSSRSCAWHRGELLPRSEAPLLSQIYDRQVEGPE